MDIFKKFSENLKKVLVLAEKIAKEQNSIVNTEHELLALLMTKETLACEILSSFDVTLDRAQLIVSLVSRKVAKTTPDGLTSDAKEAIKMAVSAASRFNHYSIDTEHLLLALLSLKKFNSYAVVERMGVKPEEVKKQIETIFGGIKDTLNSLEQNFGPAEIHQPENMPGELDSLSFGPAGQFSEMNSSTSKNHAESFLASFTTNMTRLAQVDKLDPVIGRDEETQRVIQILSRRTKNNPILIGEPGIGKTAIVEGLARRIVDGQVPSKLIGKEILSIDMGSLLAGTMYRGQFESRVKKLLTEIKKNNNIILFIDEIHTVVGAGSTEGSIDAANLLKPVLARGELRLIGSTTLEEYKKHIERDAAFERRFQPVKVTEPSIKETILILTGIKVRYEKFHHVKYSHETLEAAVRLSKRYINDRFLPDKAIDLIDEAAAATNVVSPNINKLSDLRRELRTLLRQKEELIMSEEYEKATRLREKELTIENQIRTLKLEDHQNKQTDITPEDIARIVSRWTGVPVTQLSVSEKKKYLDLEKRIKQHIVGQDEAVHEVANVIKRSRVGITSPNRPNGSFIFLGPTGVGKSELAKVLALEVLGDKNAIIKVDMSEFMERHNVARLIGAPAGYVGYEEGGKLTEAVRRNPYSIILLDEIEKAHPEVFNILLQIMEDGELTDARGRKVDFKNVILIMTSNLGTDELSRQTTIGFNNRKTADAEFEALKENVQKALENFFRPEFLNRVDKTIVFRPLSEDSIKKIVELQIKELSERVADQKISLKVDEKVKDWIAENGFDPDFGARPIRKEISDNIEAPLAEALLEDKFQPGDDVNVTLKNKHVALAKT